MLKALIKLIFLPFYLFIIIFKILLFPFFLLSGSRNKKGRYEDGFDDGLLAGMFLFDDND